MDWRVRAAGLVTSLGIEPEGRILAIKDFASELFCGTKGVTSPGGRFAESVLFSSLQRAQDWSGAGQ